MIYLDNAATTPVDPEVFQVMVPYFTENFGNPSALHTTGQKAKSALKKSHKKIAEILNCQENEIFFTSGATESNNLFLKSITEKNNFSGHIITTQIEHDCILKTCQYLETRGIEVTYLPPNKNGQIALSQIEENLKKNTIAVSIMYANNEIGSINPIQKIGELLSQKNIPFHTDAVQGANLLSLDIQKLKVNSLSISSHKIYGPKGIGILYKSNNITLPPQIHGGGQQQNFRSGTENIPGIVGFTKALEIAQEKKLQENTRLKKIGENFLKKVSEKIPQTFSTIEYSQSLPSHIHLSFENIDNGALATRLSNQGFAISTGSACHAGAGDISHVIKALNLPSTLQKGGIRISLGRDNTEEELLKLSEALQKNVEFIREMIS